VACIFAKFAEAGKKRSKAVQLLEKRVINVGGLQKSQQLNLDVRIFLKGHILRERERERAPVGML
jgi:hypothetical protein